ncbi:MAG: MFS transporter [Candidatus Aureabacteria bacterium]|nr:MFS transporter [Candidatus Auribacterota bacterium]
MYGPGLLYVLALIMNCSTGVMVVALPLLAIRFGASPLELGLLGSISIFMVREIKDIFIIAACGSFCAAFFWPPLQAWCAEAGNPGRLSHRLGIFNLSWSLGIMIGPVIGGSLYALDYRFPWCYGILSNLVMLVLLMRASGGEAAPSDDSPDGGAEQCARPPGRFLATALWANFICWFALSNIQSIYPKLAVGRGFSPQLIGYLLFLVGAVQSIFFLILRAHAFWHHRYAPLVIVHFAAAGGMLMVFSVSSVPLLTIAFPLLGCALGLSYYSSIYYSLCAKGSVGTRTGIHEFMVGSGFLLGPLVGGVLAQCIGLRAPFLVCSILLGTTAVCELFLGLSRRAPE